MSYEYPHPDDPDFQNKIYKKREFYFQKVNPRDRLLTDDEITQYRQKICGAKLELQGHQIFLSNFIHPATPYRGILIFHGTGVGKTCAAIAIAEQFKEQVDRYGTKIHVVLPGPIMKEQFKYALTTECTDYRYIPDREMYPVLSPDQQATMRKAAMNNASRYYSIISYKNFHKRVIGEKIKLKGDDGKPQREFSLNRLTSLNNTVLIIDEAHNFTNNEYGEALNKIIAASKNLRLVLMTATPMKNVPDDIIHMLNFLRPPNDPIQRSKVFTSGSDYQTEFIEGGREYLQKMAAGYVSYMKGNNPFLFAKKEDMGEIPDRLMFTPLIRCPMRPFQLAAYDAVIQERKAMSIKDSLDKVSEAVANFAFPVLSDKTLRGAQGEAGLELMRAQLGESPALTQAIAKELKTTPEDIAAPTRTHITGKILSVDHLENFSSKFFTCISNLLRLKGTAFVYTSLVKVGIRLFEEVLRANGFLEYSESGDYALEPDTLHYTLEYRYKDRGERVFQPATYIVIVGAVDDATQIPAEKLAVLQNVFNRVDNADGKDIKIVLGSKVVNEGVTMENVSEVHILDVWYHLGRVDQVIGRAIRQCKHFKMISDDNPYPTVRVFKYAVSLPGERSGDELSREEELYRKAEIKYINIKKAERALIEVSVDCPINYGANQTFEDLVAYKDCVPINEADSGTPKKTICPARCEFMKCRFQCEGKVLNTEYYDNERGIYRNIMNSGLDYTTFANTFARIEVEFAKAVIRDMYRLNDYYNLDQLIESVKAQYSPEKREMFDEFFVYKAIDDLIPVDQNDLYDFDAFLFNRYNVTGYLTHRDGFYVFRPAKEGQVKNVLRNMTFRQEVEQDLPLRVFLSYGKVQPLKDFVHYDFETSQDYYMSREENAYVGIIDHPPNLSKLLKLNRHSEVQDVFKIRERREHFVKKQREIGLPTVKGAVCLTVGQKQRLDKILHSLGIKSVSAGKKEVCNMIKEKLMFLEKFADGKSIPKKTYLVIPTNHPMLPFPLNHQDRLQEIRDSFSDPTIQKKSKVVGKAKVSTYIVTVSDNGKGADHQTRLKGLGFIKKGNVWECRME